MKPELPKRIRTEDYESDERTMVGKLSESLTPFMDSVYRVLDGGIDYDNLNQQLVDIVVLIDSTGKVINPPKVKVSIRGRVRSGIVVNSYNMKNPNVYPTSAPFINFVHSDDIVSILNVGGLQPNSQYRLTIQFGG